jgi:stage V sporulation protein G
MEITEVRVKLIQLSDDRLQAFCSITFDDSFVVRDLKIIEGASGPFVAMPSRKITSHCPQCGGKNPIRAAYCNHCGKRQPVHTATKDAEGRAKLYADIAHPINSECREMIQRRVVEAYRAELERARLPGYVSAYDDEYESDVADRGPGEESQATYRPDAGHETSAGPAARPPQRDTHSTGNHAHEDDDTFGAGIL